MSVPSVRDWGFQQYDCKGHGLLGYDIMLLAKCMLVSQNNLMPLSCGRQQVHICQRTLPESCSLQCHWVYILTTCTSVSVISPFPSQYLWLLLKNYYCQNLLNISFFSHPLTTLNNTRWTAFHRVPWYVISTIIFVLFLITLFSVTLLSVGLQHYYLQYICIA
jgi:hypothetical protein